MLGRLPRWPAADPVQQGGDVLIDPAGVVRLVHVGAGPGHRPPVERLLEARRVAAGAAVFTDARQDRTQGE